MPQSRKYSKPWSGKRGIVRYEDALPTPFLPITSIHCFSSFAAHLFSLRELPPNRLLQLGAIQIPLRPDNQGAVLLSLPGGCVVAHFSSHSTRKCAKSFPPRYRFTSAKASSSVQPSIAYLASAIIIPVRSFPAAQCTSTSQAFGSWMN
jgi:hypothetical protein